MKILHIIPNLNTGGAQHLLKDLLPLLNTIENNEIKIAVFHRVGSYVEKKIEESGVEIHDMKISSRSPLAILKIRKLIKQFDLVHSHLFPAHYYSIIANIGLNKPLVFTEHSTNNKRRNYKFLKPVERWIYKRLDYVICISNGVKSSLTSWLKVESNKFIIIENGLEVSFFQNAEYKSRKEIFGENGQPLIMISRFTDSKDHETVVRAMRLVEDKDVFCVFVGEGEKKSEIEELVIKEGLSDKIKFLGHRNNIPEIIKASTIGIQSSNWEGFGLSVVEMMAGGLPIIASDVDGLKEIVGENGLLFKSGDEKDLANKINLLLRDKNLRNNLSAKGEERATHFSIENTAQKHQQVYRNLYNLKNNL